MPVRWWVDQEAGVVHFELGDTFETDEMLAAVGKALAERQAGRIYHILSDHRQLQRPATPDQIRELVDTLERSGAVNGARGAVVVSSDASYGMMRMLSARAEGLGFEIEVFRDIADAEAFVSQGPDKPPAG